MPPSRCVVQVCDNETDLDAGISIDLSPLSDRGRLRWKKFVDMHRKIFGPRGQFGICSLHFTKNCFTRTVHIPWTLRGLKPGASPTIWKQKATSPVSSRSRRRASTMADGEALDLHCKNLVYQARMEIGGWPKFEDQLKQYFLSGRTHMTILLCGKTGVGKSHLTNALINRNLAKEGDDLEPETVKVTPYHFTINGVKVTVYDTPGLADGTGNEEEYLRQIRETHFDVVIFCTEMNARRMREDDIRTIEKLTAGFDHLLWEHAVVALTFANEVHPPPSKAGMDPKDFFESRMRQFKKRIKEVLSKVGVSDRVISTVPFVAAGDMNEPQLPGIDNWLTTLWVATFKQLNRDAKPAFFRASIGRLSIRSCNQKLLTDNMPTRGQRQRRSFPGLEQWEQEYTEKSNNSKDDGEDETRRFKCYSMPGRRSKSPPMTKPKPKKAAKDKVVPAVELDDSSLKEVVTIVASVIGRQATKVVGDLIVKHSSLAGGLIFTFFTNFLKRWLWDDSSKEDSVEEDGKKEEKDEWVQEVD
ncbi:uncharacterized protein [Montipora foliosa]|uniref:uncharacterized protein isoform X1 n=2 Tax=Montipora foliosa TaxID=591990 RepID=UPI0035F1D5B5